MPRARVTEAALDEAGREVFNLCVALLGNLLHGQVVGLLMVDRSGLFVSPRPGDEKDVLALCEAADWKSMRRLAEEYVP